MKKVIKISLAAVAALLFFLNVSLKLNGNKVVGMDLSTSTQTAQADAYCFYKILYGDCYCSDEFLSCLGLCPNGFNRALCEGAIVEGK